MFTLPSDWNFARQKSPQVSVIVTAQPNSHVAENVLVEVLGELQESQTPPKLRSSESEAPKFGLPENEFRKELLYPTIIDISPTEIKRSIE